MHGGLTFPINTGPVTKANVSPTLVDFFFDRLYFHNPILVIKMNQTYNTIYRLFNLKLVESQKTWSVQMNLMKTRDPLMYIMEVQFLAQLE